MGISIQKFIRVRSIFYAYLNDEKKLRVYAEK